MPLCAGKEHRNLRSINSQFTFLYDDRGVPFIRYREDIGYKTNKGGLKHRKIDPKVVDMYSIQGSTRCPVSIIHKYLSMLPVGRTSNAFYLQPLHNFGQQNWFQDKAVGINKLQK